MKVGNNFIQPSSDSNYNPLAALSSFVEGKASNKVPQALDLSTSEPAVNISNELKKLNLALDDFIVHLATGGLANYSFHIIVNPVAAQKRDDELIAVMDEVEELEIEPLDIKRHADRVAHAIQNHAFVAFKRDEREEQKLEAKFAPKWADLIEKGKIKQLRVIHQEGEEAETIKVKEVEITRFTAAEIDHISTVVFGAVNIASQIRNLEQQQLEKQRKKDQEELDSKANLSREEALAEQFKELLKRLERERQAAQKDEDLALKEAAACLNGSGTLILNAITAQTEEVREKEKIEKEKRKKERILKREIEDFELKKENTARERKVKEIRQEGA